MKLVYNFNIKLKRWAVKKIGFSYNWGWKKELMKNIAVAFQFIAKFGLN